MNPQLRIDLNEKLYLRDPQGTDLGRRLLSQSIGLIDEIGFEQFTFRKLAQRMGSTETSLYRYFENKHRLLVYLVSWYWAWLGFQIRFHTHNVADPAQRLRLILGIMTRAPVDTSAPTGLNEAALYRIVVNEASKSYLIRDVDGENQKGLFQEYKRLVASIAAVVSELQPAYPYPRALVSTALEAARKQLFFVQHLPSLTDTNPASSPEQNIYNFLENLIFGALRN